MSKVQDEFAEYFSNHKIDLLIILGDRYEMLSVAIAAAMQGILILHIHGGEATFANYDEFIRHCITKMSRYHITATESYRQRVIQLGEFPSHVFNLGSLGAENCLYMSTGNIPEKVVGLPSKGYFVVLFHPETLTEENPSWQMDQLLGAVSKYPEFQFVFLGANADTHSDVIRLRVKAYVDDNKNALYFESLSTDAYHYLLKNAVALIGNSSSGLIEAPSLGVYTINIGRRQDGRERGDSVLDVPCREDAISEAMSKVICGEVCREFNNPYYKKNAACNYYRIIKGLLTEVAKEKNQPKCFFDLCQKEAGCQYDDI